MGAKIDAMGQPVAELPVLDVERARQHSVQVFYGELPQSPGLQLQRLRDGNIFYFYMD